MIVEQIRCKEFSHKHAGLLVADAQLAKVADPRDRAFDAIEASSDAHSASPVSRS